jgi:hypothetical protein
MDLLEMIQSFFNVAGEVDASIHNTPANPAEGAVPLEQPLAPAPEPAEVREIQRSIHARIKELVLQHFERAPWKRRLSVYIP